MRSKPRDEDADEVTRGLAVLARVREEAAAFCSHWLEDRYMKRVIAWSADEQLAGPRIKGRIGKMLSAMLGLIGARGCAVWAERRAVGELGDEVQWLGVEEVFLLAGVKTGYWTDQYDGRGLPLCATCLESAVGAGHFHWHMRAGWRDGKPVAGELRCSVKGRGVLCKAPTMEDPEDRPEFYPLAQEPGPCWSCVEGALEYWAGLHVLPAGLEVVGELSSGSDAEQSEGNESAEGDKTPTN